MTALLIILAAITAVCAVVWGVDFYCFMVRRYSRFHIGRWRAIQIWKDAIIRKAVKWTHKTPTIQVTDNSRYVLLDILNGNRKSHTIQSWQNAALILGLLEFEPDVAKQSAKSYLTEEGTWLRKPVAVDAGMLSYAILKASKRAEDVKPAMDETLKVIIENTDDEGLISYCGGKSNRERYVDTLGLTCPFLSLYAKTYNQPEYAELAFRQLEFYHDNGLYLETGLPNHAINKESKLPLGVYGWGRGTVWYILGLMDTYQELPAGNYKNCLLQWIREAAENYLHYQREDGGFGSSLQRLGTYDSSATAGLAYFYRCCGKLFDETKYLNCADRCLQKLRSVTRITGAVDWCQGDTRDIGVFAQTYDVMPFAQGLAIRAFE